MATERNVVDFKIHNLTEEQFQELKAQGKIDPNAVYCTPDITKERLDALETKTTSLESKTTSLDTKTTLLENNKQDVATAINYDNITNCITEIPQDIKLELANGVLTLKAGSKVYVPNGAGVFDAEIVNVDIPFALSVNNTYMLFKQQGKDIIDFIPKESAYSGPNISFGDGYGDYVFGYDTESNSCGLYENDGKSHYNLIRNESFPICIFTVSNGAISSIDQVFNGFGYIGSTVFALPGVKGLVPNGRNTDGTLKNIATTMSSISVITNPDNNINKIFLLNSGGVIKQGNKWFISTTQPSFIENNDNFWYNPDTNLVYYYRSSGNVNNRFIQITLGGYFAANASTQITSFNPRIAFRAIDYNDTDFIAHQVMPSNRRIDLTLGASGASYTAPADGWLVLNKLSSGTSYQFVQIYNTKNADRRIGASTTNNAYLCATMPLAKGDRVLVEYSATGDTKLFRFIYANGAK